MNSYANCTNAAHERIVQVKIEKDKENKRGAIDAQALALAITPKYANTSAHILANIHSEVDYSCE